MCISSSNVSLVVITGRIFGYLLLFVQLRSTIKKFLRYSKNLSLKFNWFYTRDYLNIVQRCQMMYSFFERKIPSSSFNKKMCIFSFNVSHAVITGRSFTVFSLFFQAQAKYKKICNKLFITYEEFRFEIFTDFILDNI